MHGTIWKNFLKTETKNNGYLLSENWQLSAAFCCCQQTRENSCSPLGPFNKYLTVRVEGMLHFHDKLL